MKIKLSNLSWILVPSLLLGGCDPEFSSPVGDSDDYDAGSADPADFIVIGDSLSAGYADGALYRAGQINSYPKILSRQLQKVGGGEMNQPLMAVGATGSMTKDATSLAPNVRDRLVLVANPDFDPTDPDSRPVVPGTISPVQNTEIANGALAGTFQNLGIPGAKSYHLLAPDYGDPDGVLAGEANPFFARFASSITTSVLADAAVQAPSLFMLWIGNNDVLLYALEGGVGEDRTGDPDTDNYGPNNDITDPGLLSNAIGGVFATLKNANNKAIIGNIPQISAIPYFTTVPFDAIPLDAATAAFLNSNPDIAAYNAGVTASIGFNGMDAAEAEARQIEFVEGNNPILIIDDELTDLTGVPGTGGALVPWRQTTAADFILLPTASKLGEEDTPNDPTTTWGVAKPLEDGDVLTEAEAAFVETARLAYNVIIEGIAAGNDDILLFDAAALLDELNDGGISYGTGVITSTFATGGGFSLDGVHPTQRGYAVIANAIIDVMNEGFGAAIPRVDPGAYPTVYYQ